MTYDSKISQRKPLTQLSCATSDDEDRIIHDKYKNFQGKKDLPTIRAIRRAGSGDQSNIVQQTNSPPRLFMDNIREDISERTKSRDWEFSFANSSRVEILNHQSE